MDNNNTQANQPQNSLLKSVLASIGSTEDKTFYQIGGGLGADRPAKGDRIGWSNAFNMIHRAANAGLVTTSFHVETGTERACLTEAGVAELKRLRGDEAFCPECRRSITVGGVVCEACDDMREKRLREVSK